MIVAKTRMKKIPKSCNKCALSMTERHSYIESIRVCEINKKECPMKYSEHKNLKYIRPDWCPLIEMKYIAESDKWR